MDKTQPSHPASEDEDRYLVPGLVRGLSVLQIFSPERRELTLSEIARHLGTTRSAAFRTVYTLTRLGYLLHDARRKIYALGPAVLRLGYGYLAPRELVEIALPALEDLRDEIDWSTHLGVREERHVLYMLRAPSHTGISSIVQVGSRLPAAATAMGRVLLAGLSEAEVTALYRGPGLEGPHGRSPRSLGDLLTQWRGDRARGLVIQHGRFESGVLSIAAPVRDLSGKVVAAINAARFVSDQMVSLDADSSEVAAVTRCAQEISRQLGAPSAPLARPVLHGSAGG